MGGEALRLTISLRADPSLDRQRGAVLQWRFLHRVSRESVDVEVAVNGQPRRVDDWITVARLLEELGLADKHVAVEVNLELVPRPRHARHRLAEGDRLEIVTLVGGG